MNALCRRKQSDACARLLKKAQEVSKGGKPGNDDKVDNHDKEEKDEKGGKGSVVNLDASPA